MSRLLLVPLLLVLLLGSACTSIYNANAQSKWPQTGDLLVKALRWQEYSLGLSLFAPEEREAYLARTAELGKLKMVDGRLEAYNIAEDMRHAESVIVLEYYRLPSATVRSVTLRQSWEYRQPDKMAAGDWFCITPIPPFP